MSAIGDPPQPDLFDAFRKHESVLIRFLARQIRCRTCAQDLAQEIFLRIQHIRRQPIYNPRAFLFQVAANLASTYRAKLRRRSEVIDELAELQSADVDELTPERHLLAADQLARIAVVLQNLPERTRDILVWHRYDGIQQAEIARRLGISTTAVEKHLRKAVAMMATAARADEKSQTIG